MNRQRLIVFIVSLAILIGVIAGVNYFYFQPRVLLTMPNVARVKVPQKTKQPFNSDLYAGTMEQILSNKDGKELLPTVLSMVKRNPFLWPEEVIDTAPPLVDAHKKSVEKNITSKNSESSLSLFAPEFRLSMVIVGENRKLALVNNQFITEGNIISGYDVVKIEPRTVLLASKDDQRKLTLEPGIPLQYLRESSKKNTPEKKAATSGESVPLDFQTQVKQVLKLYSDPNLLLK